MRSLFSSICAGLIAGLAAGGIAGEPPVNSRLPAKWTWSEPSRGNTCGVYSVARALHIIGRPTDVREFWSSEYIGQMEGSTPDELKKAIASKGCYGTLLSRMSLVDISISSEPIIANVRRDADNAVYDHWVCVSRSESGLAVFDGANPGVDTTYGEFLARWNGIGIVVSESQFAVVKYMVARVMACICILGLVGTMVWAVGSFRPVAKSSLQMQVFCMMGILLLLGVMSWLLLSSNARNKTAFQDAIAPFLSYPVKRCTLVDVYLANENPNALLVDARKERDFSLGTIGRAVNIPVTASQVEMEEFLRDIPKDTPVILFCQSEVCPYDDIVARKFYRIGFRDITVSDLGYAEALDLRTQEGVPEGK